MPTAATRSSTGLVVWAATTPLVCCKSRPNRSPDLPPERPPPCSGHAANRVATSGQLMCYLTRVTGFLWDRGGDRLWRQGVDLIGDDRGGQGGKRIEDGAVFWEAGGGGILGMTDDGFDDVAPVEQCLVEERHREALHVAPDPCHQGEAAAEQAVREVLADVAFVAKQFPDQPLSEVRQRP